MVIEPLTSLKISLHDEIGQKEDIIKYIKSVVRSDRRMRKWREEDQNLVIDTLSQSGLHNRRSHGHNGFVGLSARLTDCAARLLRVFGEGVEESESPVSGYRGIRDRQGETRVRSTSVYNKCISI